MKEIVLTQGKVALVDDEDYEWLTQWKWHAHFERGRWYAIRKEWNNGKSDSIRMHRQITNASKGMDVDHWDGDGLNNTRINLRVCTRSQNNQNMRRRKTNKSGYKGVHFREDTKVYEARIYVDKKPIIIGYYLTAKEAAWAYDEAAKEHYGEFAKLNLPTF